MISLFLYMKSVVNKKKTATVGVSGSDNVQGNVSNYGNVSMLQLEVPRNGTSEGPDRREPRIFIVQV